MAAHFEVDAARETLKDASGRQFDPVTRTWLSAPRDVAAGAVRVDAIGAATWLQRESSHPLRIPVGVIGPREASAAQLKAALDVGGLLATCGLVVVCGGRQGVMQ